MKLLFLLLILAMSVLAQPGTNQGPTLPTSCVPGQIWVKTGDVSPGTYYCDSGGMWTLYGTSTGSGVVSFNSRTGVVVPQVADYTAYYPLLSGSYVNPTWISSLPWTKITDIPEIATISSGSGVPTSTPAKLGDVYIDTDAEGITYIAECATTSACWREIGSGSATGLPNYSQSFTSSDTVTLTHNAGTTAIHVTCFDDSDEEVRGLVGIVDINTATVVFAAAKTGVCNVNASGGGRTGGSGDTTAVANSGAGETILKAGTNVTARTLVAGANITITPATDTLTIASTASGTGSITAGPTLIESPTGTYNVNGAFIPFYLSGSGSFTFTSVTAGQCAAATTTLSLPGALNGDVIKVSKPTALAVGWRPFADVTSADTVTISMCNWTGTTATPTGGLTYKVMLWREF